MVGNQIYINGVCYKRNELFLAYDAEREPHLRVADTDGDGLVGYREAGDSLKLIRWASQVDPVRRIRASYVEQARQNWKQTQEEDSYTSKVVGWGIGALVLIGFLV